MSRGAAPTGRLAKKPGACVNVPEKEKIHGVRLRERGLASPTTVPTPKKTLGRRLGSREMPIRAAIRSITRISPLHETHAGIPNMNADYQPGQKPTMANRHVAGFVAPAFVRPRKTTARRSEVSYVPSSVRNERSDHSSVTCAGGSRARCCVENMLVAPVWGIKISRGRKRGWTGIRLVVWTFSQNISSEGDSIGFRPRHGSARGL